MCDTSFVGNFGAQILFQVVKNKFNMSFERYIPDSYQQNLSSGALYI